MRKRLIAFLMKLIVRLDRQDFATAKDNAHVITLGREAMEMLRNPVFDACMKKIEADLVNAWRTSPPKAEKEREHLYYRMEGVAQVRLKLNGMATNMLMEQKLAEKKAAM